MTIYTNIGIGTDIEEVDRFRKLDKKKDKIFLDRIFTENERKYCFSKKDPAHHLAVRFAGKEAVIKALSNFKKTDISYNEIEILNNNLGVPTATINHKVFELTDIHISLSHCKTVVVAFAVATRS